MQICYFTKFCHWQLLLGFEVLKYGYFRALGSTPTWALTGHQQTLSTKFLYIHRLERDKNKMNGILFEWSHLFPLALNVIVNFLFYLGCGNPNLWGKILSLKIQSKNSIVFATMKTLVMVCLSHSKIEHFCSKNFMHIHRKIDCIQGRYHLHISSPEWLNAKH